MIDDMVALRFGRDRRIRRRADFVRVQAHGERATSRHFVLLVAAREPERGTDVLPALLPSRLGVVATRKVGDATMRNRIKRVCRECFRQWPGFVPDGIDLVVIGRSGADELPLARVRDEWAGARHALLKRCESVLKLRERAEEAAQNFRAQPAAAMSPVRTSES